MTVGGTTDLTAGAANDITLDNAIPGNTFTGDVTIVSGNTVSLRASGNVTMAPSTIGAFLDVISGGTFTVNNFNLKTCEGAQLTVENLVLGFNIEIDAGGSDLTVTSYATSNTISRGGAVDLQTSVTELINRLTTTAKKIFGDVTHDGDINITGLFTGANVITNDLLLLTAGGGIFFNNDVTLNANLDLTADTRGGGATSGQMTGTGTITLRGAGVFSVNASTGVNLTNGGADTTTITENSGTLTVNAGNFSAGTGALTITASNALLTVTGNVTTSGGAISLLGNGISQGAASAINAGSGTVLIDGSSTATGDQHDRLDHDEQ